MFRVGAVPNEQIAVYKQLIALIHRPNTAVQFAQELQQAITTFGSEKFRLDVVYDGHPPYFPGVYPPCHMIIARAPLLGEAILYNRVEIARCLIENGANLDDCRYHIINDLKGLSKPVQERVIQLLMSLADQFDFLFDEMYYRQQLIVKPNERINKRLDLSIDEALSSTY